MIQVSKKELAERKFTPYDIVIRVESEDDHAKLVRDCKAHQVEMINYWNRLGVHQDTVFRDVISQVLNHVK